VLQEARVIGDPMIPSPACCPIRSRVRICDREYMMVCAEDVINIYKSLMANDIQAWLTGGWGVDALLQKQTRPHKDLDILLLVDDIMQARTLLSQDGYELKERWPENRWVMDRYGVMTATAFVLRDTEGREVDAHAMRLDSRGNGVPAWRDEGLVFKREDLAGKGMIAGCAVHCLSPEMQVLCHTGYDLPHEQLCDLKLLHEKFGVEYPTEHSRFQGSGN
jgi:lincosamide nucleotidyltransferase A/C/D/E